MKTILILSTIFFYSCSFAQTVKSKSTFEMIKVPDSIKAVLSNFLTGKEKVPVVGAILIYNLINKRDYLYKDGIFSFRLMGAHFNRQIFIVNKGKIHILDGYYIDELLPEFNEYIRKTDLPTKIKISYLKVISVFLDEEYNIENS